LEFFLLSRITLLLLLRAARACLFYGSAVARIRALLVYILGLFRTKMRVHFRVEFISLTSPHLVSFHLQAQLN